MYFKNGKYLGEFKDNKRHGQGTHYYSSGDIEYQGEFKDGKRHGQGTQCRNGMIVYQGEWCNNLPSPTGLCKAP